VAILVGAAIFGPHLRSHAATLTWTGARSSDFYDANNWVLLAPPSAGDVLNITNGNVNISPPFISSGRVNWSGGTLSGALTISNGATMSIIGPDTRQLQCNLTNAGTVTLSGPLRLVDYNRQIVNQAGALIDVQADVAISGGWSGQQLLNLGTFRKSGGTNALSLSTVAFVNSGLLDIQSGTLTLSTALAMNGGTVNATMVAGSGNYLSGTLAGKLTWAGGDLGGGFAVATNGTLVVSGDDRGLWCNITNAGTLTLSGPLHLVDYNRQIVNLAGALIDMQRDISIGGGWSGQNILNAGTFLKSAGTNTCAIDSHISFQNNGTLLVQSGRMDLPGGGTLTGACTANPGAAITFSGGALSLDPHAVFSGGGFVGVAGGGPSLSGTMATTMSWTAGTIYGGWSIASNGLLVASGPDAKNLNCNLTNAGTITLSGPLGFVDYNRLLVNLGGALFDVQADVAINGGWSGQQLLNLGTFRKSGGTNTCAIESHIAFQNSGAIQAQNGTIQLNGGGALTGSCSASSGANIQFNNGAFVADPAAVFSGSGFVGVVNPGTPTFTGTLATSMRWTGGGIYGGWSIAANGRLAASGPDAKYLWCNLTNAGTITLSGPMQFCYYDRLLVNQAGALIDVQADVAISGGWSGQQLLNLGTFRKSGGTNTLTLSSVTFANSELLDIQSGTLTLDTALAMNNGTVNATMVVGGGNYLTGTLAGKLAWAGGDLSGGFAIATNGTLVVSGENRGLWCDITNAGTLTLSGPLYLGNYNRQIVNLAGALIDVQGDISIGGGWSGQNILNAGTFLKSAGTNTCAIDYRISFTNSGVVRLVSGSLRIGGGHQAMPGSTLSLQLGGLVPDAQFSRLLVDNTAHLDGTLNVTLASGYSPAAGSLFPVVVFSSKTGNFSALTTPPTTAMQISNAPNAIVLVVNTVTNLPPGVVSVSPSGSFTNAISSAEVTFNMAIDASSFTPAAVVLTTPSGVVPAAQVTITQETPLVFRIGFPLQTAPGLYSLAIGPNIKSIGGQSMAAAYHAQFTILAILPDFIASDVGAPATAGAGQPVSVVWRVSNAGNGNSTNAFWNTLWLATDTAGDSPQFVAALPFTNALPVGQSLAVTGLVVVPLSALGDRFFMVTANGSNTVAELNMLNNTAVASQSTRITSGDLALAALSAPPSAQFGQTISVSWVVSNNGNTTANGPWQDRLYLGSASNSLANALVLLTVPGPAALAAGASYTNAQQVTLPTGSQMSAGTYYLTALADAYNNVLELTKTNNSMSVPITLSFPPLPSLAVSQIVAPAVVNPGKTVSLAWCVTNQGTAATVSGGWSEAVYFSGQGGVNFNPAQPGSLLATFSFTNDLAVGGFLWRTQQVTLPALALAGDFYTTRGLVYYLCFGEQLEIPS
jgi:hypothetical protein